MPPLFLVLCGEDACEVGLASRCDEKLRPDLTGLVDDVSSNDAILIQAAGYVIGAEEGCAVLCDGADVVVEVVMSFIGCSPS